MHWLSFTFLFLIFLFYFLTLKNMNESSYVCFHDAVMCSIGFNTTMIRTSLEGIVLMYDLVPLLLRLSPSLLYIWSFRKRRSTYCLSSSELHCVGNQTNLYSVSFVSICLFFRFLFAPHINAWPTQVILKVMNMMCMGDLDDFKSN